MGFFAVAHLAARHGITVTLSTPPDGGTSAEVHLPAALISPEVRPPAWMGPPGEVFRSGNGGRAGSPAAAGDPLGTAPRFAAGPEPAPEPAPQSAPEPVPQAAPEPARESARSSSRSVSRHEITRAGLGGRLELSRVTRMPLRLVRRGPPGQQPDPHRPDAVIYSASTSTTRAVSARWAAMARPIPPSAPPLTSTRGTGSPASPRRARAASGGPDRGLQRGHLGGLQPARGHRACLGRGQRPWLREQDQPRSGRER